MTLISIGGISIVKEKLISRARSMGYQVYKNSSDQWVIRLQEEDTETLLEEEKSSSKWLLVCDKVPQIWLTKEGVLEILEA